MIEIEVEARRVNFAKFTDYIQKNYRKNLNECDYKILQAITNTYSNNEIKLALDYCKDKGTDSLIYLQKCLKQGYYKNNNENKTPSWFEEDLSGDSLDEEDKEWLRNFYKKYCRTEEQYYQRLKETGLEENLENAT